MIDPGGRIRGIAGRKPASETGQFTGRLGGITILVDETGRIRRPGAEESEVTELDSGRSHFLMLELTSLKEPPQPEERYTVVLLRNDFNEPVFNTTVMGRDFSENYTLCLSLEAGTLSHGWHSVKVINSDGDIVFQSGILSK